MPTNDEAEWLRQPRIVDELVRAELLRRGLPVANKSFDEMIASGELKAAECRVRSKDMVTPGWLDRAAPDSNKS